MPFLDPLKERLAFVRKLTPTNLKRMAGQRVDELILGEALRARRRVDELVERYPSAGARELSQRLIDSKKGVASVVGGIGGVLGVASVPLDLVAMVYLQISLLCDVATLHKVNLKTERSRKELMELFGYANGIGPVQRAGPKLVGSLAGALLQKGGLKMVGKALPLIAAPISAHLNGVHIQRIGDEAVRHYDGFDKAREKSRRAGGQ